MQKKAGWGVWSCMLAVGLAGCVAHREAQHVAAKAGTPPFTVQTPIDRIAADKNGRAVLERDVPGVMSNPHYVLYSCMSLAQVASLSGGRLSQAKLEKVNEDLAKAPPCPTE